MSQSNTLDTTPYGLTPLPAYYDVAVQYVRDYAMGTRSPSPLTMMSQSSTLAAMPRGLRSFAIMSQSITLTTTPRGLAPLPAYYDVTVLYVSHYATGYPFAYYTMRTDPIDSISKCQCLFLFIKR